MGLHHAIDEGERRSQDDAQEIDAAVAIDAPSGIASRVSAGALGALSRVVGTGSGKRGRRSAWRIAALAIITYTVALNLSYFFVLKPIWNRRDELVTQKMHMEDLEILVTSRDVLARFRDGLMRGDQRMTVISEIEGMADVAGLEIIGEPGLLAHRDVAEDMREFPIDLTIRGTYHEVGRFLSLVSGSQRRLMVKQIDADIRNPATGECDVSVVIGVVSWDD